MLCTSKTVELTTKKEKEFIQNLEWKPDGWDGWGIYTPALSMGDLSVGVKSK